MSAAQPPVPAIDIVSGIWTEEALSYRPGWQEQFFAGKMKSKTNMPFKSAPLTTDLNINSIKVLHRITSIIFREFQKS